MVISRGTYVVTTPFNARRRETLLTVTDNNFDGRAKVTGAITGAHTVVWLPWLDNVYFKHLASAV